MIRLGTLLLSILFVFTLSAQDQDSLAERNIDKYLKYFSGENPGAVVAVYKKGEIVFSKAYGLANLQTKQETTSNQLFDIREISKTLTSLAIIQLEEKGKLSLDENLKNIFRSLPDRYQKVKIRNLLDHTSGLVSYDKGEINTSEDLIKLLADSELMFEPETSSKYSNSDYALLAKIVEMKSGKRYADFVKRNIFKKLKMTNTFFAHELNEQVNKIAIGHIKSQDSQYVPTKINSSNIYGEEGVYTNIYDFAKLDYALYTNKLLKCENLQKIFTVNPLSDEKKLHYYGAGWVLMKRNDTRYYWHGAQGNGYSNIILHLPDTQTTVLILTNRNDGYDFLKMAIYIAKEFDKELNIL